MTKSRVKHLQPPKIRTVGEYDDGDLALSVQFARDHGASINHVIFQ